MIISVHIPRTAGSSFRAYLRGSARIHLKEDYGNPIMVPSLIRNSVAVAGRLKKKIQPLSDKIDCLHGHFLPYKYKDLVGKPGVKFITWLRDPADRIRSQFDYCFQSNKDIDKSPFQNKVARENWSFEAFYSDARMKNLYSKFFWKFPLESFECIGIVEHYETDYQYICEWFFNDFDPKFTYGNRTNPVVMKEDQKKEIYRINQLDCAIYQKALEMRASRLKSAGANVKIEE